MVEIFRALKDKALYNPAFCVATVSAGWAYASSTWELPGWATGAGVLLGGVITRALVQPSAALARRRR